MYRRLLIPVRDPSEVEPLIRFAADLLEADGEIRVLHIIPTTTMPELTRQWRSSVNIVIPAHETGAALDLRVDPEVRAAADVSGEILESAEAQGIDAIVMTLGADRRSRLPLIGHTSSAILHHAPCDVVVVNRLALVETKVPRILIPSFFSSAPPKAMRLAEDLSLRRHGIPIVTLSIRTTARGQGEDDTDGRGARTSPTRRGSSFLSNALLGRRRRLPELILQHAARERYGLLVVGEEAVHAEGPLLTRRFLEELFRAAPCPVLAVRG